MRRKAILILLFVVAGCAGPKLTDAQLETAFRAKRESFEQLKAGVCSSENPVHVSRSPRWSRPELSSAEWAMYLDVLSRIEAYGAFSEGNCSFHVPMWRLGRSDMRGISHRYFVDSDRAVPVASLDDLPPSRGKDGTFYIRHLENGWYSYHVTWH